MYQISWTPLNKSFVGPENHGFWIGIMKFKNTQKLMQGAEMLHKLSEHKLIPLIIDVNRTFFKK